MKKMLKDKSGKFTVRQLGLSKKNNILATAGALIGGTFLVLAATGGYQKWIAPNLDAAGITSSVEGSKAQGIIPGGEAQTIILNDNQGDAASFTANIYDIAGNAASAVDANLFFYDATGNLLGNQSSSASFTDTVAGDTLFIQTDSSSIYLAPSESGYPIDTLKKTANIDAYAIATETSMKVTVMDSDGNALTADDNSSNNADYSISIGSDGTKKITYKLENNQANKVFRVGAICVYESGDADSIELTGNDWVEVAGVPKELDKASMKMTADDLTNTTVSGYDRCYVPEAKPYVQLDEWDELRVPAVITASSTDPTANTGDGVAILAVDYGCNTDKVNAMVCDFYRHDDNERSTEVGLSDTVTSPEGLTTGVLIELQ